MSVQGFCGGDGNVKTIIGATELNATTGIIEDACTMKRILILGWVGIQLIGLIIIPSLKSRIHLLSINFLILGYAMFISKGKSRISKYSGVGLCLMGGLLLYWCATIKNL